MRAVEPHVEKARLAWLFALTDRQNFMPEGSTLERVNCEKALPAMLLGVFDRQLAKRGIAGDVDHVEAEKAMEAAA